MPNMSALNPLTKEKEFGGVPGAFAITTGLPTLIVALYFLCNDSYVIDGSSIDLEALKSQFFKIDWVKDAFFNNSVWNFYLSWFFGLLALDLVTPGQYMEGITLRDGTKLGYKINGLNFISILSVSMIIRLYLNKGYSPELEFIYENFLELAVVSIIFSALLATFVFICSYIPLRSLNGLKTKERILSINGNSESGFYNWFIGRELNPRIGPVDIKLFCELKPGLLLWLAINFSCIHHQYWNSGTVCDALLLVNFLQLFYIFDGVLNEAGVLSMMDITTDGFGFMLAFGDLSLVPFTYCLQSRYLSLKPIHLGAATDVAILALMFFGYYVFHQSNQQKSDWKLGKLDGKNYKFIKTKTGTKLLCDGWWGLSQHTNYFGDWLISWSWCFSTGFNTPLTYYYVAYFGGLLLHRQQRDEAKCSVKYGEKWDEYKRRVPYKIIPYVY
ncbi:delta(14)-sterol reductase [Saccharomycopsis crataegensis]|uniref:Delta(14)-sterol reductase n=1 Tax=Saccharomycopsis crataegensis TaxID=43959 RepID=A0AAV5QMH0_9ASCO|nr:delta(14)-sterol reductase [Saccharomycopsis crataegensis]